jgi:hypothetical protein
MCPYGWPCCCCWRRWGETSSLNCGHQRAYCSSLRWHTSVDSHGLMISTGENSWRLPEFSGNSTSKVI